MDKQWYIVFAESGDWCGCQSTEYKVFASSSLDVEQIAINNDIESEVREFYTDDEEDDEYIADPCIIITIVEAEEDLDLSKYPELK